MENLKNVMISLTKKRYYEAFLCTGQFRCTLDSSYKYFLLNFKILFLAVQSVHV